jgi:Flp pilus assembly protein TadD
LLNYLVPFSEALLLAGENIEAMEIAKEITDTAPEIAHLGNWRAALLWKCGRRAEAICEQKRAIKLVPNNYHYKINLVNF